MKHFHPAFIVSIFAVLLCSPAHAQPADIAPLLAKARNCINNKMSDSGIIYADSVLKKLDLHDDDFLRSKALGLKGKALFYQGKTKEAVELYFQALRLCKSPVGDKQAAYLNGEIGYAYYSQGHYNESKQYYEKEIAIRREVNGRDSIGNQLINLSVMYQSLKDYDSAQAKLNEIASILTRNNDSMLRGFYYFNIGALMEATHRPDSAADYYHKAYAVWKSLGQESQIFRVTFNLGYLAFEQKKYKEALSYFHLSEASAKKFGLGREVAQVYASTAEAYASDNDFKNAYAYLHQYATLNDSLGKQDFNNYVVKLDKQFQTEKNRQTIQAQQLKLNTANLEVQQQRSNMLLILLVLIAVLFIAAILFGYITFQKRLQKSIDETKARFFANVAHEIRTPLSMIQGPISILQNKITDPALNYQLDMAERNTNRLNDLINQMLDISKLDAAKYRLNEHLGNLNDFIAELLQQYEDAAREKQLTFSIQTEPVPGNVLFDKDALEKIISNLLGNAIKYTPANGTVGIELFATKQEDTVLLTLNVWDTGPGIAKPEQAKVFDRFYRSGQQIAAGTKGMGIGLSLVKELVTLMNGTISLESEPGKGAAFTVQLPLKQGQATIVNEDSAADDDRSIILLVEDDKDILDFNKTLLAEKGYHVITATNGNEAGILLKYKMPDLIITDLMMPEKDGLALLQEVQNNHLTDHIPVIILSAKTSAESKKEGITGGAQAYLAKPFLPGELVALVNSQLQLLRKQRTYYRQQTEQKDQSIEERFSGPDPFTQKCYLLIQQHLDDAQLSVEKLADLMNINRSHFQRKIKTLTGYSPSELIRTIRLEKARELLLKREGNITEIAYATGFTSQSYFTKCFSDHFGYPPSQVFNK